jgi:hypothetical protein
LIPVLRGLVDDAGLFPPSSLSMADALDRHRRTDSPLLSGLFLCPVDRADELVALLGPYETLEVHLIGAAPFAVPDHPRLIVKGVELRSGSMPEIPCYVEGVGPRELSGTGGFGKVRCGGATIPEIADLAAYITMAARLALPFKATAGLHAAVRGWESTDGVPHHGFLNVLLGVARGITGGNVASALASTDAEAIAHEVLEISDDLAVPLRYVFRSFGSCDTTRPVTDARDLGLL